MKSIDVSVIIPNRNYAKYIADAILSVKSQTLKNLECIIVDDASTDNSVEVIRDAISDDTRFKLITNDKPVGISRARNMGIDVACGDYIAFLDSDDCYTEYALDALLNLAKSMNADVAGGQTLIVPENYKYVPTKNKNWTVGKCWIQNNPAHLMLRSKSYNWVWVWRRIYKRTLFNDLRFIPELTSVGDDIGFMLDLCHRVTRIVETETMTVFHRSHRFSVMQSSFNESKFNFFPILLAHIRKNLLDKYDNGFLHMFYNSIFRYMLRETIVVPQKTQKCQNDARQALIAACKEIPRKYLTFRRRILCWFLSCMK